MRAGDVIYIEANCGAVKRVGRCDAYATEADLEVCFFLFLTYFLFYFLSLNPPLG